MSANQACFPIAAMARVLGVSKAGYYAWLQRPPSARATADAALLKRIKTVHASSRQTYGAPRVPGDLHGQGERHSRNRIARLMREAGLVGASHRHGGPTTTRRNKDDRPAPDLVDRDFHAAGPNQLWVADITYVPTMAGFLYLAVVLDAWSRKIVGWAMANHLRAELVLDAMEMAVGQRRPKDVIHHSDQGSQGGINWSSQHNREECCDGRETAVGSSVTGQVEVARAAGDGATWGSAALLGVDSGWSIKRGRGDRRGGVAAGRDPLVSGGWWHALFDICAIVEAAVWALSGICRAGGDRARR